MKMGSTGWLPDQAKGLAVVVAHSEAAAPELAAAVLQAGLGQHTGAVLGAVLRPADQLRLELVMDQTVRTAFGSRRTDCSH